MTKTPKPIDYADLARVAGGAFQTSPLGSLSLHIARTQPPATCVAKSFDVLTLASPLVGVTRVSCDDSIPRLPPLPKRSQWQTPVPKRPITAIFASEDLKEAKGRRRRP